MRCCGRSAADVIILFGFFLVTGYSVHSYYTFLFPQTLNALGLAFLQPFGRGVERPTSAFPLYLHHLLNVSPRSWILFGVSFLLFLVTLWAYLAAVLTDAGQVPRAFHQRAPKSASLALRVSGSLSLCAVCASYKPQRAHHCSRCRRCVLKYDHHCPWLGRCVGFFNYKLYLLVVLYTFVLTLWVTTLLLLAIVSYVVQHYQIVGLSIVHRDPGTSSPALEKKCWKGPLMLMNDAHFRGSKAGDGSASDLFFVGFSACSPFLGVYICLLESIVFLFLSASLLRKHWWLARHNLTTLDLVIQQHKLDQNMGNALCVNPFDIGVKGCLHQVFGDGDEHGEHIHLNFFVRWFFRLLPFPAYPKQMDLCLTSSSYGDNYDSSLGSLAFFLASSSAMSAPSYGTLGESCYLRANSATKTDDGGSTDSDRNGECRRSLLRFSRYTGSRHGLCFPTVSSFSKAEFV